MSQKTSRQGRAKPSLELSLTLSLPKGQAGIIRRALAPELNAVHARRSTTSIGIKSTTLSVNIRALDASALRASLNSCLGSVIVSRNVLEV